MKALHSPSSSSSAIAAAGVIASAGHYVNCGAREMRRERCRCGRVRQSRLVRGYWARARRLFSFAARALSNPPPRAPHPPPSCTPENSLEKRTYSTLCQFINS
uniref:Uncharacterized protein n=1 Tax=Heliothis virescens TaxID=7102 RepID=A0A2A4JI93_HELVI